MFNLSILDKTIKLWKISEREKRVAEGNFNLTYVNGVAKRTESELILPKLEPMELVVEVSPRRVYANAHTYHINSISVCPDQETFLSADDLRINLWHHEVSYCFQFSHNYFDCLDHKGSLHNCGLEAD